jgi:hypothetical protein
MNKTEEERCDCSNCSQLSERQYNEARETFTIELDGSDIHSILGCMEMVLKNTKPSKTATMVMMQLLTAIGKQTIGDPVKAAVTGDYNTVVMEGLRDLSAVIAERVAETGLIDDETVAKEMGEAIGRMDAVMEQREAK